MTQAFAPADDVQMSDDFALDIGPFNGSFQVTIVGQSWRLNRSGGRRRIMATLKSFYLSIISRGLLAVLVSYIRLSNRRRDNRQLTEPDRGSPTVRWDNKPPQVII